jgi:hypothetical protein
MEHEEHICNAGHSRDPPGEIGNTGNAVSESCPWTGFLFRRVCCLRQVSELSLLVYGWTVCTPLLPDSLFSGRPHRYWMGVPIWVARELPKPINFRHFGSYSTLFGIGIPEITRKL